jgi:hypothetical protein
MMFLSGEPNVKAVKDSYWKEDRTSQEEAPSCIAKAKKDVCKPCK